MGLEDDLQRDIKAYLFSLKNFWGKRKFTVEEVDDVMMTLAIRDEFVQMYKDHFDTRGKTRPDDKEILPRMYKRAGNIENRFRHPERFRKQPPPVDKAQEQRVNEYTAAKRRGTPKRK